LWGVALLQIASLAELLFGASLFMLKAVPQIGTLELDFTALRLFEAFRGTSMSLHLGHDVSIGTAGE